MCFRRNFLKLNIYMRDLRVQELKQLKAYTLFDLLSKSHLPCEIRTSQQQQILNGFGAPTTEVLLSYSK